MAIPEILANFPDWAIVFIIAATPVIERVAIPVAVGELKMNPVSAVLWTVLGDIVPIFLVYGFGDLWLRWVEKRRGFWHRLTDRVLGRSQHHFKNKYEKYGLIALPLLVGIPLPLTGAWTGALAAFIFGIPFRKAMPLIVLGIFIAVFITLSATNGAMKLF
ncbi:MAG: small multi-drug export protein [Patescibacteria group bacterium]